MAITITNIVATRPTAPGGTGSLAFDFSAGTATADVYLFRTASPGDPGGQVFSQAGATPGVRVVVPALLPHLYNILIYEVGTAENNTAPAVVPGYAPPAVAGCTDPAADNYDPSATQDDGSCTYTPPPRYPHFRFSPAQSLRFVQPDDASLPEYDNRFFAQEQPLGLNNPGYCQKAERGDTLVVQWQSNYNGAHTVRVVPCAGGAAVLTRTPTQVVVGAGTSASFDAYARPDTTNAGRTRIYFNDDALPLPFLPGARITLVNAGSLNGTYPVVDVREDPAAGVPYLALNVPYPGGAQRIDLSLTTPYNLQAFDTWQVVIPFASVPEGCFQVRVGAVDSDFGSAEAMSEPVDVATTHRDTVLVVYRNFDNAFGLNYTAGLVNRLRVVGRFYERDTATQKTTLRESTGKLTLLSAEAQRRIALKVFQLPDYVHEKLAVAFCHDFVRVNDLRGIAEERYEYPPTPAFTLSNGSVQVEQEDFLGAGNRDDVGDVDGGPFLIVNNEFLAINP